MAEVLAVVNQKGGVGKTTTAGNVGGYLADSGKRVLVVDLDPQANASSGVGVHASEGATTVYQVLLEQAKAAQVVAATAQKGLHILPSNPDLTGAAIELLDQPYREFRLRRALRGIGEHFDYILIHCPPSLGLLTINGLVAADRLLIPVQCEFYALEGLRQLLTTVKLVRQHLNPKLQVLGAVMTMYDRRTTFGRRIVKEVRQTFPGHVFECVIPRNAELAEAPSEGVPIKQYAEHSRGAKAYEQLAEELLSLYS